jgi:diguanylate cyclase (GGDEF)-like protein
MKVLSKLSVMISAAFIVVLLFIFLIPSMIAAPAQNSLAELDPILIISISLMSIIIGVLLGRQVSQPLTKLTKAVEQIGAGDFDKRIEIKGPQEIRRLTQAFNEMAAQLEENGLNQSELLQRLEELAITDDLTGLFNRRELNRLMELEYKRAKRYNRPFSMIMLDIDHFKQYNDTFGHLFGDEVIKWVANLIATNTRSTNYVARYGGDEFVILLPETTCNNAFWAADRLRKKISETPFCGTDNTGHPVQIPLTVSLGVSELTNDIFSVGAFFSRTDQALYVSKSCGRDQAQLAADQIKFIENNERVN